MTANILRLGGLLAPALLLTLVTPALAVQRTFVASTGLDTNPCNLVSPCRGCGLSGMLGLLAHAVQ